MIRLSHPTGILDGRIKLPSSKSISNRLLIIKHLYFQELIIHNLSDANDTQLLNTILENNNKVKNVQDAGTAYRFLTAMYSALPGEVKITGTSRLKERPISELVECMRMLGATIVYEDIAGQAPLRIMGGFTQDVNELDLRESRSSQYISALLLILPKLKNPPELLVDMSMLSWSFVQLTLDLMKEFGFQFELTDDRIKYVAQTPMKISEYYVEADWTSFYYWFTMAALSKSANLLFTGLNRQSIQTESEWFKNINLGMIAMNSDKGLKLSKDELKINYYQFVNLGNHPDLAPTFSVLFAALGMSIIYSGLESLKYKESDREMAIKNVLGKLNVEFDRVRNQDKKKYIWSTHANAFTLPDSTVFHSFNDHRMVMAVAPLALIKPILIEDEHVVSKSYPNFWDDLKNANFVIEKLN